MPKKFWELFSKTHGPYLSSVRGNFAAVTTEKIAGRLDCHSGKRAKPKNRIFLRYLEDMPEGFRPCKICKPDVLRAGDRLSRSEKRTQRLLQRPHIAVVDDALDPETLMYDLLRWRAVLRWDHRQKKNVVSAQRSISERGKYRATLAFALTEGQRLNLPVIKYVDTDEIIVLYASKGPSTSAQKRLVNDYRDLKPSNTYPKKNLTVPLRRLGMSR